MAKTQKRPQVKPKRENTEQRMLRERRAELRKTQRATREVGQLARKLRSDLRRADYLLSELRDHLNSLYPEQRQLPDESEVVPA